MTASSMTNGNGNGHTNGSATSNAKSNGKAQRTERPHPQVSYIFTGESLMYEVAYDTLPAPVLQASDACIRPYIRRRADPAAIHRDSFYGQIRSVYSNTVLKTQLDQMRKQGSYDAFKLQWHPAYDVRRLDGAKTRVSCLRNLGSSVARRYSTLLILGV
jgi:hypothetical protein